LGLEQKFVVGPPSEGRIKTRPIGRLEDAAAGAVVGNGLN